MKAIRTIVCCNAEWRVVLGCSDVFTCPDCGAEFTQNGKKEDSRRAAPSPNQEAKPL